MATVSPKLLRLIAVLVAFVVPLQGMAALAASQCMSLDHHEAPAMHHEGASDHDHAAHPHDEQKAEDTSSHCGPCAACCASVSLATPPVQCLDLDAPEARMAPLHASFVAGIPPDELDRPPLAL